MGKFCKYCGKQLYDGVNCDCPKAIEAALNAPFTPIPYCKKCGKSLKPGEICTCSTITSTPPPMKSVCRNCGKILEPGEVCACTAPIDVPVKRNFCGKCGKALPPSGICSCSSAGVKISMETKSPLTPDQERLQREGESFFKRAGELD